MKFTSKTARMTVMPNGAEVLGHDGRQTFYGTDDGLGSAAAVDVGNVTLNLGTGEVELPLAFPTTGAVYEVQMTWVDPEILTLFAGLPEVE